ncbi:MAG: UV DNA damage repair endonuclease UvsE [Candidatus Bipolaricaulota bacterium]|nr:UV DNA damage repair endonuclease UvsE [Candidatus Bipolaricaulota bacterium]
MRIGYPCINLSLPCRPSRTFRLANLAWERLRETLAGNLACLEAIVRWNAQHGLLFLRITSDLVPLASHPQNRFPWDEAFAERFGEIGALIRSLGMRISMHPGQYTLLNSPRKEVVAAAVRDLAYHARVLDLLGLDRTAKIQIHVGGVYGDKARAMERFVRAVEALPPGIRERLAVENDEKFYTVSEVLRLCRITGLPAVFDVFHHELNPDGTSVAEALVAQRETWGPEDGLPIVDYSSPLPGGRPGSHAYELNEAHFLRFLEASRPHDFDLMLEVKDKERSALRALALAADDPRLVPKARGLSAQTCAPGADGP